MKDTIDRLALLYYSLGVELATSIKYGMEEDERIARDNLEKFQNEYHDLLGEIILAENKMIKERMKNDEEYYYSRT